MFDNIQSIKIEGEVYSEESSEELLYYPVDDETAYKEKSTNEWEISQEEEQFGTSEEEE